VERPINNNRTIQKEQKTKMFFVWNRNILEIMPALSCRQMRKKVHLKEELAAATENNREYNLFVAS
jgi:hypothetical protein